MPSRVLSERSRTRSNSLAIAGSTPSLEGPTFSQFARREPSFGVAENRPPSAFVRPNYPHTSIFRSSELVLNLFSSTIKVPRKSGQEKIATPLPVYGDRDRVMGSVVLDLPSHQQIGHFTVSVTGSFFFHSPGLRYTDGTPVPAVTKQNKHVFYSASLDLPLSPGVETGSRSMFRLRKSSSRPQLSKMRSVDSFAASDPPRAYPFDFEIPQPLDIGQEMPPTFAMWSMVQSGDRGRASSEIAEVSYKVSVQWDAGDASGGQGFVESPILFQPDSDFQPSDSLEAEPDSWSEFALHSENTSDFECAMTIPNPTAFPRSGTIPYFVIFKTTPMSPSLARAIASTASISLQLVREVTIDPFESQALGLSAPPSPSSSNPSSSTHERFLNIPNSPQPNSPTSPQPQSAGTHGNGMRGSGGSIRGHKVWKRMLKSVAPDERDENELDPHASLWNERADTKQPERLSVQRPGSQGSQPDGILREVRVLHAESNIGFPKRPRHRSASSPEAGENGHGRHSASGDLPDGLFKSKVHLSKSMLPTVDWPGVSIKYYLDVSIIFADSAIKGRVPLRIY